MYRAPEMLDLYQNFSICEASDIWVSGGWIGACIDWDKKVKYLNGVLPWDSHMSSSGGLHPWCTMLYITDTPGHRADKLSIKFWWLRKPSPEL